MLTAGITEFLFFWGGISFDGVGWKGARRPICCLVYQLRIMDDDERGASDEMVGKEN
jgi:hypothetical protein